MLRKFSKDSFFLQLGVLLVAILIVVISYIYSKNQSLRELELGMKDSITKLQSQQVTIFEIHKLLGYGGVIHNFKNYVLRREQKHFTKANKDIENAFKTLRKLDNIVGMSAEKKAKLEVISNTFLQYKKHLQTIRQYKGKNLVELDRIVKVDDKPALLALDWLEKRVLLISQELQQSQARKITQIRNQLTLFSISAILLVFVLFFLFAYVQWWNLKRLKSANEELKAKRSRELILSQSAAVGDLAGNIAHEINNPLAIIMGYANNLKRIISQENPNPEKMLEMANRITITVERIAKIVKSLLAFTRQQEEGDKEYFALRKLVLEIQELSKVKFDLSRVELKLEVPENFYIYGHRALLGQVLVNLVNNAYNALKDQKDRWIKVYVVEGQTEDKIIVEDSGELIDPEIRAKLMSRLFTTNRKDGGTGIGLSISKAIVERHAGTLALDEDSKNTRFVLTLPRHHQERSAA